MSVFSYKKLCLLPALFAASFSFCQTKNRIIYANSKAALIVEGADEKYNWELNPETIPDIYTTSKNVATKWVRLYTDIDSIITELAPGEHIDFIILLNGKDSCHTRFESPPVKRYSNKGPVTHDTIHFVLTEFNTISIKSILNDIDTLSLAFDSGTTGLLLTKDAIGQKTHLSASIQGVNKLQIGRTVWPGLNVRPVAVSAQETDGRFGWDLFDGKVIEIDYDHSILIVHSRPPQTDKVYSKLAIEYTHTLFCVEGYLQIKNRRHKNRFLFDNGYQRTIMLDTTLMNEQNYPHDLEVIKRVIMKNGKDDEYPVLTVNGDMLSLGDLSLHNIPAQIMTTANPAEFRTHIIGNEVLKRFNTILDFQNNYVYLKPNHLAGMPYADAK